MLAGLKRLRRSHSSRLATWAFAVAAAHWAGATNAEEGPYTRAELAECGYVTDTDSALNDYRLRESTSFLQWSIGDVKKNHYDPAIGRIRAGEFSRRVMADLHFLLRGWPNHYPALEALIEYDRGGGLRYEYLGTNCYFIRARQFVPDDINVVLYEGYYYWKKHNLVRAKTSFEEALKIDPASPDANYDLGLIAVELGDLTKAAEYARTAYAAGYPLPGLRRKLERAGHPLDSSTAAAP